MRVLVAKIHLQVSKPMFSFQICRRFAKIYYLYDFLCGGCGFFSSFYGLGAGPKTIYGQSDTGCTKIQMHSCEFGNRQHCSAKYIIQTPESCESDARQSHVAKTCAVVWEICRCSKLQLFTAASKLLKFCSANLSSVTNSHAQGFAEKDGVKVW